MDFRGGMRQAFATTFGQIQNFCIWQIIIFCSDFQKDDIDKCFFLFIKKTFDAQCIIVRYGIWSYLLIMVYY